MTEGVDPGGYVGEYYSDTRPLARCRLRKGLVFTHQWPRSFPLASEELSRLIRIHKKAINRRERVEVPFRLTVEPSSRLGGFFARGRDPVTQPSSASQASGTSSPLGHTAAQFSLAR